MRNRFCALATDYDGTLAHEGRVSERTLTHLHSLRERGVMLLLVTGRRMSDLAAVFPGVGVFHLIVAENGAVIHDREKDRDDLLASPPPERLVAELHGKVPFLETGRVIIATRRPFDRTIDRIARREGVPLAVTYNREAAMFLPPGVDKCSGLAAALSRLGIGWEETVGIGDAENDEPFLRNCGCSVATENALPRLKERVDVVTREQNGAGVVEAVSVLFYLRNDGAPLRE